MIAFVMDQKKNNVEKITKKKIKVLMSLKKIHICTKKKERNFLLAKNSKSVPNDGRYH